LTSRRWCNLTVLRDDGMMTAASPATTLAGLRRLLLGLLAFGLVGTATDLILIGHDEDAWQVIPLAAIAMALVVTALLAFTSPAAGRAAMTVRLFRAVMLLLIVTGGVGAVLHYRANMEFKLEMDPSLSGLALFTSVVRAKAPPAMAPATMVLLGLLGLAAAYRRPDDPRFGTT
jgi:hypothetical protein